MSIPLDMKIYRYQVTSFDVLMGGETITIEPAQINSIIIEKDFDNDSFPVLRVSTSLDVTLYQRIVANKLDVRFRMRMQKFTYNAEEEVKTKTDVFNASFCIFLDENTPFMDESTMKRTQEITGDETTPQSMATEEQTFFLFKEKDVIGSNRITNVVLANANMTDTSVYLLSTAGFNQVLMTPLENTQNYPEVLVPPVPLLGALDHLEAHHGFYSTGAIIFFDTDRTYFIKRSAKCTAWSSQEYKKTVFHVKKTTNPDSLSPGCYDDTENKNFYINIIPTDIAMRSPSVINDVTEANNLIVITPSSNKSSRITSKSIQMGSGNFKVLVDAFDNPYSISSESYKKGESANIIDVIVGDYDIASLSPNKEFSFIFEDTAINSIHGGSYRISSSISTFTKQGDMFSISGQHTFKREPK